MHPKIEMRLPLTRIIINIYNSPYNIFTLIKPYICVDASKLSYKLSNKFKI